ncbi:hypothetical protein MLD38_025757 [Melastoma candidum]|uniref:Uncharacterized protein n=1 Tax=Melastoma candidum TaxID=119954 RepID=A0ACB9NZV2_9MYRT|nr:hypothetical protein MLD38_025757 [Melastoma candidum]
MGKGRGRGRRSSPSSIDSNSSLHHQRHLLPSSSSSTSSLSGFKNLGADLTLGISPSFEEDIPPHMMELDGGCGEEEGDESGYNATFYVKVYMEGIPIGRKLDLLAHDGYHELITTLDCMFNTSIIWSEMDEAQCEGCHVLTYEDKEGDWLMVGDVPWEIFLSCVRRLKITRIC